MAGHSHWKQIKVQKGSADQKRAKVFSKLLIAISVAAKKETNPDFNPRLRTAIQKAKDSQVPQENIERAVKKALEQKDDLEEMIVEAYGPGGTAILIEGLSNNSNRTINELKLVFKDFDAKLGVPGSVRWAFEPPKDEVYEWQAKFKQKINGEDRLKLDGLIEAVENIDEIQKIYTNAEI